MKLNDEVTCEHGGKHLPMPGMVVKIRDNGIVRVRMYDGKEKTTLASKCRLLGDILHVYVDSSGRLLRNKAGHIKYSKREQVIDGYQRYVLGDLSILAEINHSEIK